MGFTARNVVVEAESIGFLDERIGFTIGQRCFSAESLQRKIFYQGTKVPRYQGTKVPSDQLHFIRT